MVEHTVTKRRQKDLKRGSIWATRKRLFYTTKASQDPRFNSKYYKKQGEKENKKQTKQTIKPKPSLYGLQATVCPYKLPIFNRQKGSDAL